MGQNFSTEPVVEKDTERVQDDLFHVAVSSCQGWRTSQEDNHCMLLNLPGPHKAAFFAVFDGHGSAKVSKHASEALWKHLTENEDYIKGNFKEALQQAFLTFDQEVNDNYNAQLAGTTAICLLIVNDMIYCANIGDSRSVASVNCECVPLSFDHKPENPHELKRILAAGGYVLGNRVNGNLALSRAFGDFHYKNNVQLPAELQIVSPLPDLRCLKLNEDVDFIVLACDGIWDVLSNEEVVEFIITRLEHNMDPGLICEQLTTRCLATDYELVIGCDNMTVLLICNTRGKSWVDYCTDIFQKNCKKLGGQRERPDPNAKIPETLNTGQRTEKQRSQLEEEHEQQKRPWPHNSEDHSDDEDDDDERGNTLTKSINAQNNDLRIMNLLANIGFGNDTSEKEEEEEGLAQCSNTQVESSTNEESKSEKPVENETIGKQFSEVSQQETSNSDMRALDDTNEIHSTTQTKEESHQQNHEDQKDLSKNFSSYETQVSLADSENKPELDYSQDSELTHDARPGGDPHQKSPRDDTMEVRPKDD